MRINFFEEYPSEENIAKLALVDWPATVFLAAPSTKEFEYIKSKHAGTYPHITFGWWPTIPGSYWISGIANPSDIDRFLVELSVPHTEEVVLLVDLELPRKKSLYVRNLFAIPKNKKKIESFLERAKDFNLKIYTAEYPVLGNGLVALWRLLGISPALMLPHTRIAMCYSSMGRKALGHRIWAKVQRFEQRQARAHPGRIALGLGTLATGVLGNEPILSAADLREDLDWAARSRVEEIFIFRLGGLDKSYIEVLRGTK